MRLSLAILMLFATVTLSHPVKAGEIIDIGTPAEPELSTETEGFGDVFSRQLKYRESAIEFRNLVIERQQNFQAPAKEARQNYENAIESLNETRGTQE